MNIAQIKVKDVARLTNSSAPLISRALKKHDASTMTKVNERIVGISPEAAEEYLKSAGFNFFYRPSIIFSANLCGGVGKTTSMLNLGASLRRITNRKTPIVFIDGDSQGSLTSAVFGEPAEDSEATLIDYLDGKAGIKDLLVKVNDDNIWFLKSNLNMAWIDKSIRDSKEVKVKMLCFYNDLFKTFGDDIRIFQDHTPQLSSLFASSVCAVCQTNKNMLKAILIPIRSDKFAIQGAEYIIKEIQEICDTFTFKDLPDIHCFFSSIDKRVSTTAAAIKVTSTKQEIVERLSSVVIRYCSEIPKGVMSSSNVYTGKTNNAAEDYQDLLSYIFSYKNNLE